MTTRGRSRQELPVAVAAHRVLAGLVDLALLLAAGGAAARILGDPNVIANVALSVEGWKYAFTALGLWTAAILFLLSVTYFVVDGLRRSPGKAIFNLENRWTERQTLAKALAFSLSKSLIVPGILDLVRTGGRAPRRKACWVVARQPPRLAGFLAAGFALQFLPLLFFLLGFLVFTASAERITPSPSQGPAPTGDLRVVGSLLVVNAGVLLSNLAGGFTLFALNVRTVLTQGLLSGGLFADSLRTFPAFLFLGVLPHGLLEFSAYALANAAALSLTYGILLTGEAYLRRWSLKGVVLEWRESMLAFLLTGLGAAAILVLGAFIEGYLTSFLLNQFYFR